MKKIEKIIFTIFAILILSAIAVSAGVIITMKDRFDVKISKEEYQRTTTAANGIPSISLNNIVCDHNNICTGKIKINGNDQDILFNEGKSENEFKDNLESCVKHYIKEYNDKSENTELDGRLLIASLPVNITMETQPKENKTGAAE